MGIDDASAVQDVNRSPKGVSIDAAAERVKIEALKTSLITKIYFFNRNNRIA